MPVGPQDPARGVLDFPRALQAFQLDRRPPRPELSPWIENYWEVVWNLPPGAVHRQTNLSHVAFNLTAEDGAWLYGVPGPTFVRELRESGRVFGVKFHPGAFFPWLGAPLNGLFDRRVPLTEVLDGWEAWAPLVDAEEDFAEKAAVTDAFLAARIPEPPGEGRRCVQRMVEDRTLVRVEDACRVLGHSVRDLQRLFRREVGASPKDVLRRYRLMEAAERLAKEPRWTGADLAISLGYTDQAHFIRDFKAVTGVSPEAYRRRQGGVHEESPP